MSTHNIVFYEEISKIITELSSDIIKYAPYFFCCLMYHTIKVRGNRGANHTALCVFVHL